MANRLNAICDRRQITKYKIAKACGISENTLSYWSHGKVLPTLDVLFKVSRFLNIPASYFYDENVDLDASIDPAEIIRRHDLIALISTALYADSGDVDTVTRILSLMNKEHQTNGKKENHNRRNPVRRMP